MAEWLMPLIFSALNYLSSHYCGFESCLGHMQVLLASDPGIFLGDLPFSPHLTIDLAQNE